jgi:hypothetical protein
MATGTVFWWVRVRVSKIYPWVTPVTHYLLQQTAFLSASIGRCQEDTAPRVIPIDTDAQAVENPTTALRAALERRRHEPLTPYIHEAWDRELQRLCHDYVALVDLYNKFSHLSFSYVRTALLHNLCPELTHIQ